MGWDRSNAEDRGSTKQVWSERHATLDPCTFITIIKVHMLDTTIGSHPMIIISYCLDVTKILKVYKILHHIEFLDA